MSRWPSRGGRSSTTASAHLMLAGQGTLNSYHRNGSWSYRALFILQPRCAEDLSRQLSVEALNLGAGELEPHSTHDPVMRERGTENLGTSTKDQKTLEKARGSILCD